jgi:phosphatidylglycerophosphate synthase
MLTERSGDDLPRPGERLVGSLAHASPDVLTITGLALNGVAWFFFAVAGGQDYQSPVCLRTKGLIALAADIFGMLDGRVARRRGWETKCRAT